MNFEPACLATSSSRKEMKLSFSKVEEVMAYLGQIFLDFGEPEVSY